MEVLPRTILNVNRRHFLHYLLEFVVPIVKQMIMYSIFLLFTQVQNKLVCEPFHVWFRVGTGEKRYKGENTLNITHGITLNRLFLRVFDETL